jgi:hypothetical protein
MQGPNRHAPSALNTVVLNGRRVRSTWRVTALARLVVSSAMRATTWRDLILIWGGGRLVVNSARRRETRPGSGTRPKSRL